MEKVLFICVHNSARSQIAEEYLNMFAGSDFEVQSAGFEPTQVDPLVIEAMEEEGMDLRVKRTQSAFELYKQGSVFKYVITVCDESVDNKCPVYPGMTHRLHLPFEDPAKVQGTHEQKMAQVREIRNQIKEVIREFIDWVKSDHEKKLGDFWELKPQE